MVCLLAALLVTIVRWCEIRKCVVVQWRMSVRCHFQDCKVLLFTSLNHVHNAIANVQIFNLTFYSVSTRVNIPERVNYKLGVLTHRCLLGKAPVYLSNCCIPVSQVASRRHLRSAARHLLTVPRHRLSTYGRRAFAVAGPTMFNTLPDDLRDPAVSTSTFRQSLKTHLSSAYQHV